MKHLLAALLAIGTIHAQTKGRDAANPTTCLAQAPAVYRVKLTTTKGPVVIEVTRAWAPRGADRFYALVRCGFFTDAPFFRVIPGFMAQFGISVRPEANKAWDGQKLMDDNKPFHSNTRGTVSFASTGQPNSRGTQLFINYKDNTGLDPQGFAAIGEVVEGMDLVDMLYSGYGETVNKEGDLENGGKAYIDRYMPKLDRIQTATIVPAAKPEAKGDEKK